MKAIRKQNSELTPRFLRQAWGGFVEEPWEYLYSSARDYAGKKGLIDIKFIE